MANLDFIISGDDYYLDIVKKVDKYLIELNGPKNFEEGETNYLMQLDKSFESVCNAMKSAGILDPKNLSTFEFYEAVEYFERIKPVPQ